MLNSSYNIDPDVVLARLRRCQIDMARVRRLVAGGGPRRGWQAQAACHGVDPALLADETGVGEQRCDQCLVAGECLAQATVDHDLTWTRGGLSGRARLVLADWLEQNPANRHAQRRARRAPAGVASC